MILDLHVHSTASPCSNLTMDQIKAFAGLRGLDGVCITDHYEASGPVSSRDGFMLDGLVVIVGTEYATPQGDLLLFGPDLDFPGGLSADEILARMDAMGGAAILAHPFRKKRPGEERLAADGMVAAVEEMNGRNTFEENGMIAQWKAKYPINTVGGSDAHSLEELGRSATHFPRFVNGWQDLVAALKSGEAAPIINQIFPLPDFLSNNQLNCA
ncbi:PHP domain-containing protein [Desulfatibacillum aliphaticivorans]|uniref:PHP domain protein n=2 Tax=Desulfatibacillum aliphaticivorans TaxID=218208 RepID=B8FBJ6_DESAL|nr:PHP domain-containing protein [Desulfatibacillum aliphaticivorans]ACL04749.1 PHP domain protein [Desulfatibacillum aliphaticivorans]